MFVERDINHPMPVEAVADIAAEETKILQCWMPGKDTTNVYWMRKANY